MYRHLLVTLDGSPRAESVIPHAIDIATSMNASVTLLRVIDSPGSDWSERGSVGKGRPAGVSIQSLYAEQAQSYLERVAAQVRSSGIPARTVVRQGQPAKQIMEVVQEVDADAIAMATHSRRGFNRLMFGSVAEQILHESNLPVLLVRAA